MRCLLITPLGVGIALYLSIGVLVVGFILWRGLKLRRPPQDGLRWDKKDNAPNILFLLQSVFLLFPIVVIIELFLWPLVLLFLWAYQSDDH